MGEDGEASPRKTERLIGSPLEVLTASLPWKMMGTIEGELLNARWVPSLTLQFLDPHSSQRVDRFQVSKPPL